MAAWGPSPSRRPSMPAREAEPQRSGRPIAPPEPAATGSIAVGWQALTGALDPDGPIWKAGAFRLDPFRPAPDGCQLGARPVIVGKARWLSERDELPVPTAPIGLFLEAGESHDDLAADLPRFAVIALNFPKFSDGRAFSTARLLREK